MTILTLDINDTNRADLIEYLTCCHEVAEGKPLDFLNQMLAAIDKNKKGFTAEVSEDNAFNFIGLLQESGIPSLVDTGSQVMHSICSNFVLEVTLEAIGLDGIFQKHDKTTHKPLT